MLESGRHLYVVFCCQQAVEKALKVLILKRSGQMPPRLHNLPKLAQVAGLEVDANRAEFLLWLTVAYVRSRYPTRLGAAPSRWTVMPRPVFWAGPRRHSNG